MGAPALSVIIVTWNNEQEIAGTLRSLQRELRSDDELIVIDNASTDQTRAIVTEEAPSARLLNSGYNAGFTGGVNLGATFAQNDLLVLLNPDARPLPGWGMAIRLPWTEGRNWDAWQALVVDGTATCINTAGNSLHYTGIGWAGKHGKPLAEAPTSPQKVTSASGACLAIRRDVWERLEGFPEEFFLYHDDIDLSIRVQLLGGTMGIEPRAIVAHDYTFGGGSKWRWLEQNRWAFIIRTYPVSLLALLFPALLVTELAIWSFACRAGWLRHKVKATVNTLTALPRLLQERRSLQRSKRVSSTEFASWLSPDLDSSLLPPAARRGPASWLSSLYWFGVASALHCLSRAGRHRR